MRVLPLVALLCLSWACGSTLPVTLTATPASSPADAVACARNTLTKLGYRQTAYDEIDFRILSRKQDPNAHQADPSFRYNTDQVEATAAAGADGKTTMTVQARTFAMRQTHRGPTEEEEAASTGAKEAAQRVLNTCGKS